LNENYTNEKYRKNKITRQQTATVINSCQTAVSSSQLSHRHCISRSHLYCSLGVGTSKSCFIYQITMW